MKLLVLLILSFSALADIECDKDGVRLHRQFFNTPFDKVRTVDRLNKITTTDRRDINEADAKPVLEAIHTFKTSNPKAKISLVSVTSCASSFPLPAFSKSTLPIPNENVLLAIERRQLIEKLFPKSSQRDYQLISHAKECGPSYDTKDTNLLGKVKIEGLPSTEAIYNEGINSVLTDDFMALLKEYGLARDKDEAKSLDPNPWRVKYRFFEGYFLEIFGKIPCQDLKKITDPKKTDSKKI